MPANTVRRCESASHPVLNKGSRRQSLHEPRIHNKGSTRRQRPRMDRPKKDRINKIVQDLQDCIVKLCDKELTE